MWQRVLAAVLALLVWFDSGPAAYARTESRVALVIGNGSYQHTGKLSNPENDARDIASALTAAGFQVFEALDVEKRRLDGVLRAWADAIAKADVALFYYAGHGVQVGQQNFLLPVDAQLGKERDLEFEGIKVDFILRQMEIDREGKTSIVILDACRDNPLSRNLAQAMGTRSASVGRGLGVPPAGLGMFIAYATQPGNVALDGDAGQRNSPFAKALVKEMLVKGRNINATMGAVRRAVVEATGGRQVPWDHSSLTSEFAFLPGTPVAAPAAPATDKEREELAALRDRLKVLEEETRKAREAAPATAGAFPATMADAMRLAELRARAANVKDLVDGLQKKLFEARRIETGAKDVTERQKLQRNSINIQTEWTRRGQDLKKLRDEIASLEGGAPTAGAPKGGVQFVSHPSTRIIGDLIDAPPSTANCESRCQTLQPQCVAWSLSRNGVCELMTTYRQREAAADWRSGLRPDVAAPQPTASNIPPVMPKAGPPPKVSLDFTESDNVGLLGVDIGEAFRAPSAIACREACAKNAECVGFQHGRKIPVMGQCQLFSRLDARREDNQWRSGVRTGAAQAAAAPGSAPAEFPRPPSSNKQGFNFYDGTSFRGKVIKESGEPTADGCMVVCRNTPGCSAALWRSMGASTGNPASFSCSVFSGVETGSVVFAPGAMAIVRAQ